MAPPLMSAASACLLLAVLIYLYGEQRQPYFLMWGAAAIVTLVGFPIVPMSVTGDGTIAVVAAGDLALLAGCYLCAWGAHVCLRLPASHPHWRLFRILMVAAALWVVVGAIAGVPAPYYYIPIGWAATLGFAWTAVRMWRSHRLPGLSATMIGSAFAALSLGCLAYPFLTTAVVALPLLSMAAAAIRGLVAVGVLMACLGSAQTRLRESEDRYRLLAETARDVILLLDEQCTILYSNEAGQRLLTRDGSALVGHTLAEFVPEAEREALVRARQQCLAGTGQTYLHELHLLAASGRAVPIETSCSLASSREGSRAILLVARDISERYEERRFLASLMGNLPGMVYRCQDDGDWTIGYVSAGAAGLLGAAAEAMVQRGGLTHTALIDPADRQRVRDEVRASVLADVPFDIEYRLRDLGGTQKWVRERGRLVDTGDGHRSIEGFISDISESRRLAEQLRQSQKMEEIGRLAGGIAHDFNNLLTAVTAYGHFLKQGLPQEHEAQKDVDGLLSAAERATQLTKQLLAFSRRQALEKRPVRLNDLVTSMGQMLRRLIGEDIEISVITDEGLGPVEADPGQLEQALVNLVVNARDAMPNGGRLLVETKRCWLDDNDASGLRAGEYAMLAVSDSGVGMSQDVKAHLFEPFFTTKEVGRGTGLGLAMVYGIVQQHHGDIRIYSETGVGTTVKVYLPCLRGRLDGPAQPDSSAELPGGRETILVAEDEVSVRDLLSRILTDLGYTVLVAAEGTEALRLAEEHPGQVDLLLTDLVMPLMNGRELDKLLRQERPRLRTLFISGYTDTAVLQRGLLGPDSSFLQKPFTARGLAIAVRRLLDPGAMGPPPRPIAETQRQR